MLTQSRLKEVLSYNAETGIFIRLLHSGNVKANSVAGSKNSKGYLFIMIDKKIYAAHRLAWLYVYGTWPLNEIDHINGIKNDNRIDNLRDCNRYVNMQNLREHKTVNKSKLLGVSIHGKKFQSEIRINKKRVFLGTFNTAEEAHAAYIEQKRLHHPGCTI